MFLAWVVIVLSFIAVTLLFRARDYIQNQLLFPGQGWKEEQTEGTRFQYDVKLGGYLFRNPSGLSAATSNSNSNSNSVMMFLHGPEASGDSFLKQVAHFTGDKWGRVVVPEYGGYGQRVHETPSISGIREDLRRQWKESVFNTDTERVLVGFSLGGAFAFSILDELDPIPTKVCLIHTFADMSMASPLPTSIASKDLLNWKVQNYHASWRGPLQIVFSKEHELFPEVHARLLEVHFRYVCKSPETIMHEIPPTVSPFQDIGWADWLSPSTKTAPSAAHAASASAAAAAPAAAFSPAAAAANAAYAASAAAYAKESTQDAKSYLEGEAGAARVRVSASGRD